MMNTDAGLQRTPAGHLPAVHQHIIASASGTHGVLPCISIIASGDDAAA